VVGVSCGPFAQGAASLLSLPLRRFRPRPQAAEWGENRHGRRARAAVAATGCPAARTQKWPNARTLPFLSAYSRDTYRRGKEW